MAKNVLVAAAMRSARWDELGNDVKRLEKAGVDLLHFDVSDGHFIDQIGGSPEAITAIKKITKLPIEIHLMTEKPEDVWKKFADAGADIFIVHIESTRSVPNLATEIHQSGKGIGLTLNPSTPFEAVTEALQYVDKISVMTVNPGVGGVLVESAVPKLKQVADFIQNKKMKAYVQVDGAVSLKTRELLATAGATAFVVGYPIFSRENYADGVKEIKTGIPSV